MRRALLCGRYPLSFHIEVAREDHLPERRRSYAHFLAARPDLVDAKCRATDWLLDGAIVNAPIVDYFGGVGLVAAIARPKLLPEGQRHEIYEIDGQCVAQLGAEFGHLPGVSVTLADARGANLIAGVSEGEGVFLDFPHFTPLQRKWMPLFGRVIAAKPSYVVLTDTALSMLPVHRQKYGRLFGGVDVVGAPSYVSGFDSWLRQMVGYRVDRAAQRGRNAIYMLLVPVGAGDDDGPAFRDFPLQEPGEGFRWLEEEA